MSVNTSARFPRHAQTPTCLRRSLTCLAPAMCTHFRGLSTPTTVLHFNPGRPGKPPWHRPPATGPIITFSGATRNVSRPPKRRSGRVRNSNRTRPISRGEHGMISHTVYGSLITNSVSETKAEQLIFYPGGFDAGSQSVHTHFGRGDK